MVFIAHSTCGGTAVGVSKQGHTVVMHDTCGRWRLASGGGAYCRHHWVRYLWGHISRPSPSPWSLLQVVVLVQAVVCQWRMPKKKKEGKTYLVCHPCCPPHNCPARHYGCCHHRCRWWWWCMWWCISGEWQKKEGLTLSIVPTALLVIAPPVIVVIAVIAGDGAGAGGGGSVENDKKERDLSCPASPSHSL